MEVSTKPVELTNPEVAAKFENGYHHNPIVHVPGIYRGLLSNVTMDAANAMVAQNHQALKPKPVPPVTTNKTKAGSTE